MFRIKQVSTVCFLCFCWGIIRRVISTEEKKRFLVFCWSGDTRIWTGEKRICSPLPYHSAMSPKCYKYKIDENFPGLLNCFFIVLAPWVLFSLIFPKSQRNSNPSSLLIGFDSSFQFLDWVYLKIHNVQNFLLPFYWKIKCGFSVAKSKIKLYENRNH